MKVFIAFPLLFVAIQAAAVFTVPALVSTGDSNQYRSQDNFGNYNFGYDEKHPSGGSFRKEAGDAFGNKYGSYGLVDADGRQRIVNYVADASGFRADIKSNEPGVEPKDPASINVNKPAIVAPVVTYAAPTPVIYSAPVKAYAPYPAYIPAPVAYKTYAAPVFRSYYRAPAFYRHAIAL